MTQDKELYDLFKSHKSDIPDKDFSDRVIKALPKRKNMAPQIIMLVSTLTGLVLSILFQGFVPFINLIKDLVFSILNLQIPSLQSVMAYLICTMASLAIGFGIYKTDIRELDS